MNFPQLKCCKKPHFGVISVADTACRFHIWSNIPQHN